MNPVAFPGTIMITGASGGLGLALTRDLLDRGVRDLVLQYRTPSTELSELVSKFDLDPEATLVRAELTDESAVKNLGAKIANRNLWGVVHLAGASSNGMSWKLTLNEFRRVVDSSLTTSFLVAREVIPYLRARNGGRVLFASSIVGAQGAAGASHYAAAKAGVVGLGKSLALELAPKNITVNMLALGYFEYGLIKDVSPELQAAVKQRTPLGRFGNAQELSGLVRYLLSEQGAFMTGQVLHLNGGLL